jgi:glycosyltransferase involved in cell wall biosynthesis
MSDHARKKVLHIITRLDPGGSAENTVLCTELINPEIFDSSIITGPGLDGSGPPEKYLERLGDRIQVEPELVRPLQPANDFKAISRLKRSIKRIKPDIIHLHSAKAGTVGRVAAKFSWTRAKVIYTPHGHVFSGYGGSITNTIFTLIEKNLVKWSDAIVALTPDEIKEFELVGAGSPQKFCVIPSGVEVEKFFPDTDSRTNARENLGLNQDDLVVGFVGRLDPVKGPDLFLETVNLIHQKMPEVKFVIAGEGELRGSLHKREEELELYNNITWLGWREDTEAIYPAFDLFALTSRNEGQGRVLVESMATGIPHVAMNSGGVAEVVKDGETGILVPAEDIEAASDTIIKLLLNPALGKVMGKSGRKRAEENFSINVMISRLEQLYRGLLEGKTPKEIF